jgi:NAD(P)-dependent dehydrogenase (short-subunit alcohol dehydrogenase family)
MDVDKGVFSNDLSAIRGAFEINFYGTIQTTLAFLPLIRKAPKGRGVILVTSTDMASNGFMATPQGFAHHFPAYNTSKAALNSWVIALARTLKDEGTEIKVNSVTPGFTTTKLNGYNPGGHTTEKAAGLLVPYALLGPEDKETTGMYLINIRHIIW